MKTRNLRKAWISVRRKVFRRIYFETLEPRLALTGEAFRPFASDNPVIDPPSESILHHVPEVNRTALTMFPDNSLAANHAKFIARKNERIQPLETATFELGPYQGNQYANPFVKIYHDPPTPGGGYEAAEALPFVEFAAPEGFFDIEGLSAANYDPASHFLDLATVEENLMSAPSWEFSDTLYEFIPASPEDYHEYIHGTDLVIDRPDPTTTITTHFFSARTIHLDADSPTGNAPGRWTYSEKVTNIVHSETVVRSQAINRRFLSWTLNIYDFSQQGTYRDWGLDMDYSYTVDTTSEEAITDSYSQTHGTVPTPLISDSGLYAFEVTASREVSDRLTATLTRRGDAFATQYSDFGALAMVASFVNGESKYVYDRREGDVEAGSGSRFIEAGFLNESSNYEVNSAYTGSGTINVDDAGVITKLGTRRKYGNADRDYRIDHHGEFDFTMRNAKPSPDTTLPDEYSRSDKWSEVLEDAWQVEYVDNIEYLGDGASQVHRSTAESGNGVFHTNGSHGTFWRDAIAEHSLGSSRMRFQAYGIQGGDRGAIEQLPARVARTDKYDYTRDEDIILSLSADGIEMSKTGFVVESGSGEFSKAKSVALTHLFSEQRTGDYEDVIRGQNDSIVEELDEVFSLSYRDETEFLPEFLVSTHSIDEGAGESDWTFANKHYYAWQSVAADGTWKTGYVENDLPALNGILRPDYKYLAGASYRVIGDTTVTRDNEGVVVERSGNIITTNSGKGTRAHAPVVKYLYVYLVPGLAKSIAHQSVNDVDDVYSFAQKNEVHYYEDGSSEYVVTESGGGYGSKGADDSYLFALSESASGDGGSWHHGIRDATTVVDREIYRYQYEEEFTTNVDASAVERVNAVILDEGVSVGNITYRREGGEDYSSSSSGDGWSSSSGSTETWDAQAHGKYTHAFEYTTVISPDPTGGAPYVVTVNGSETTVRSNSWWYSDTYSWWSSWSGSGGSGSDSDSYTTADSGSELSTDTFTNDEFCGPRALRKRMYGWNLEPHRFDDHGRENESWDAAAGPPV